MRRPRTVALIKPSGTPHSLSGGLMAQPRLLFLFGFAIFAAGCSGASTTGLFGGSCDGGICQPTEGTIPGGGQDGGPGPGPGKLGWDASTADDGGTTVPFEAGAPCSTDDECPGQICNWKIKR